MAHSYTTFTTTPANLAADLKTNILLSTDYSNPTASVVKSTTTRGAQIVLNLAKVTATAVTMGVSAWRTWTGTAPGTGADETATQYLTWRNTGGATTDSLYCIVSASKEHLFISVEGPRAGDTNNISAGDGSNTCTLYLGDLVPYHGGDTVPATCLVSYGFTQAAQQVSAFAFVSRNQGDTVSWVPAVLTSLNVPTLNTNQTILQHYSKGDGKTYVFPYVVLEQADGIRGRLGDVFYAGWEAPSNMSNTGLPGLSPGMEITYDSKTYVIARAQKWSNTTTANSFQVPWGKPSLGAGEGNSPLLLAIRKA